MSDATTEQSSSQPSDDLARANCTLGFVRATELAAIAASAWRGKGDEMSADMAAGEALATVLSRMPFDGRVVVGEGVHTGSDQFQPGQKLGTGEGAKLDVAVDPLEGTTRCAKAQNDAMVVLAATPAGGLMRVPSIYMDKIAIASGYPDGLVDLNASAADNIQALARAKKAPVSEISACVLDRPRHAEVIEELRSVGCSVKLIADGDIAAIIHAANIFENGIDVYLGSGGAPEGVLAAAAIKCLGGFMQARFVTNRPDSVEQLEAAGIDDPRRVLGVDDLVPGEVVFAATGVTDGTLVAGVETAADAYTTSTVVMESWSGTVRRVRTRHAR